MRWSPHPEFATAAARSPERFPGFRKAAKAAQIHGRDRWGRNLRGRAALGARPRSRSLVCQRCDFLQARCPNEREQGTLFCPAGTFGSVSAARFPERLARRESKAASNCWPACWRSVGRAAASRTQHAANRGNLAARGPIVSDYAHQARDIARCRRDFIQATETQWRRLAPIVGGEIGRQRATSQGSSSSRQRQRKSLAREGP